MPELWDDPSYYDDTYYEKQWAKELKEKTIMFVIIVVGGGVIIAKLLGLV